MAPRLRAVIDSIPEIRDVMSHVGRPDDGTDVTSYFNLEFNAPLFPMEQWREKPVTIFGTTVWSRKITREEIQDELMAKFKEFPAINFNFSQLIRDNVEEALSGVKGANSIKLFGNDLAVLERSGQRVVNILNTVPGISNAGLFHIVGQPNLEIQIDRHECARYGINVADVEAVVQVAIGGRAFTRMVEGEKVFDIVLRLPADQRNDPEVIGRIPVDAPGQDGKPGQESRFHNWLSGSTRISLAPLISTERTTAATFPSNSPSRAAIWLRRSWKLSVRSPIPKPERNFLLDMISAGRVSSTRCSKRTNV